MSLSLLSLLILAVLEGGQAWDWNAPQSIGAFGIGAALLVGFVLAERHAAEPVLPLWVLSRRLLLNTVLIGMAIVVTGTAMLAAFAFAPNIIVVALCCLVVGLGLGLVSAPGLIVAAAIAMPRQRAVPDTAERENPYCATYPPSTRW